MKRMNKASLKDLWTQSHPLIPLTFPHPPIHPLSTLRPTDSPFGEKVPSSDGSPVPVCTTEATGSADHSAFFCPGAVSTGGMEAQQKRGDQETCLPENGTLLTKSQKMEFSQLLGLEKALGIWEVGILNRPWSWKFLEDPRFSLWKGPEDGPPVGPIACFFDVSCVDVGIVGTLTGSILLPRHGTTRYLVKK